MSDGPGVGGEKEASRVRFCSSPGRVSRSPACARGRGCRGTSDNGLVTWKGLGVPGVPPVALVLQMERPRPAGGASLRSRVPELGRPRSPRAFARGREFELRASVAPGQTLVCEGAQTQGSSPRRGAAPRTLGLPCGICRASETSGSSEAARGDPRRDACTQGPSEAPDSLPGERARRPGSRATSPHTVCVRRQRGDLVRTRSPSHVPVRETSRRPRLLSE